MSGNYRQTSALSTDGQWISAEPSGVEFQSQKGAALLILASSLVLSPQTTSAPALSSP